MNNEIFHKEVLSHVTTVSDIHLHIMLGEMSANPPDIWRQECTYHVVFEITYCVLSLNDKIKFKKKQPSRQYQLLVSKFYKYHCDI